MRIGLFVALALFCATSFSPRPARADEAALTAQLQQILDAYVKDRASIEGLSGAALQVDRGEGHPILAIYAGDNGLSDKKPIGPDTLFDIGSNTKEFTAALILKLEAAGKLNIDDTIGRWLPQYPAWKDVTIRSLLQMTSPIPNYSETVAIGEIEVADLHHQFSAKDLMGFVDPENGNHFPPATGWFYSNTNYILAGLIIEAASGMNYEQALTTMILEPLGLHNTYYAGGPHPGPAAAGPQMARVPRALYMLQDCLGYQPEPCKVSTLAPLIGNDMRMQNRSWAAEAGPSSRTRTILVYGFALFSRSALFRKTTRRVTTLVSNTTGLPLPEVTPSEPGGFGLGLGRFYRRELAGPYWFYEGETLGFRTIFAYWPKDDLLITGSVNSRPPNGEDQFGPTVFGGAFTALKQAELIEEQELPAEK